MAAKIQADLAKIGIKANIKQMVNSELYTTYRAQKAPLIQADWSPDYPDADGNGTPLSDYAAESLAWRNGWDNAAASKLAQTAAIETNAPKRLAQYKQLTALLAKEGPFASCISPINPWFSRRASPASTATPTATCSSKISKNRPLNTEGGPQNTASRSFIFRRPNADLHSAPPRPDGSGAVGRDCGRVPDLRPALQPSGGGDGQQRREEQLADFPERNGLNKPLATQYVVYMGQLLRGDMGTSLRTQNGIVNDLPAFFPATLELTLVAVLFALLIGLPLGVIAALYRGRPPDCWHGPSRCWAARRPCTGWPSWP